jgi:hypothetical protein
MKRTEEAREDQQVEKNEDAQCPQKKTEHLENF